MRMLQRSILGLLVLLLLPAPIRAQQTAELSGRVTDADTGAPLPGVNVFLDETTYGAATDAEGRYAMRGIPPGTYRLVASMVGYETGEQRLNLGEGAASEINLELTERVVELEGLAVTDNRSRWLRQLSRFEEHFLGEVDNARQAELLNPEVLHFETDDETDTFVARAEAPLEMINHALGYRIAFHLEQLEARGPWWSTNMAGQFHELEPENEAQARQWQQAREETYRGSFMHFVRALSADRFEEEGFRLHLVGGLAFDGPQPSGTRVRSKDAITRPRNRETELGLSFPGQYLRVEYLHAAEETRYVQHYRPQDQQGATSQLSWIELPAGRAVINRQTGFGFAPFSPMLHGYWSWWQRAPNMLPGDYVPGMGLSTMQ